MPVQNDIAFERVRSVYLNAIPSINWRLHVSSEVACAFCPMFAYARHALRRSPRQAPKQAQARDGTETASTESMVTTTSSSNLQN